MQNLKQLSLILIIPVMLLSYRDYLKISPRQLQGTVMDATSGQPVKNAYLFVLKGNEEIFSNDKGEFKLNTWQDLPLSLTIEHKDYKTEILKITGDTKAITIKIRKK